jgi:ASC-1-like (ASCH) protein
MDHIAYMKKSWGFCDKILRGEKTIESRWYMARRAPWNRIGKGDIVYFKNTGEPVSLRARVRRVVQFDALTPTAVKNILSRYGSAIGIPQKDVPRFIAMFRKKKYAILVFLRDPKLVRPFEIKKSGFGAMASWISVERASTVAVTRLSPGGCCT